MASTNAVDKESILAPLRAAVRQQVTALTLRFISLMGDDCICVMKSTNHIYTGRHCKRNEISRETSVRTTGGDTRTEEEKEVAGE